MINILELDQLIFSYSDTCTKLILDITYPNKFFVDKFTYHPCSEAARNGHLNLLIWLKDHGYNFDEILVL